MKIHKQRLTDQHDLGDNTKHSSADRTRIVEHNLTILGHEIRNPLSALSYALDAWPVLDDDPQLRDELLQIIRRQVSQLLRLCEDLLDTSRTPQDTLSLYRETFDIRKVLQKACEEIRPFAEHCGHTMIAALGDLPMKVSGDESRLIQVFANLLHNAAKFTDHGGRLYITLEREDTTAVVRVLDNGRGISAEKLGSIFYSERTSEGMNEGFGIGLRLAKSIIELHDGSIEVISSGLGHGSVFVVRLPLIHDSRSDSSDNVAFPSIQNQNAELPLPKCRIMVIDDDRSIRFLLTRLLRNLHQSVTAIDNCEQAIETILRVHPQVIFLDLQMPGIGGFELARRIRRRTELNDVVLVALSGNADDVSRRRAIDCGFDQYLEKPTSLGALSTMLHKICEGSDCATAR